MGKDAQLSKAARWREAIPLCLSLGAFAMSGFTFYDQYLRSEVELWVQVPRVEIVWDYGRVMTRLEAVLVNKGNVPAIVFGMSSIAAITDEHPEPGCEGHAEEAGWARISYGAAGNWLRPRAISVKANEPAAVIADIPLVGRPDDGVCVFVEYLAASGVARRSTLWVRHPLKLDEPVAMSPKLRRLRHGSLDVLGGKQNLSEAP